MPAWGISGTSLAPWLVLALVARSAAAQANTEADADAKFNARAALISARVVYLTTQSYAGVTARLLKAKNPELSVVDDAPSSGPAVLSVKVQGPRQVSIAVYGKTTCWGVREEGRQTGVATRYARRPGPASDCTATSFKDADFLEDEAIWRE